MADFEKIWAEHQSTLRRFIQARVSDPDEVDDLLQLILVRLYEKHGSIKSASSVRSWLFQVAKNAIIDHYRKQRREHDLEVAELWQAGNERDVFRELSDCLTVFVSALPKESAKLILAIDINGQSQKACAEEKNISYSTLKSRVQKARTQLRNLYLDCCHFSLNQKGSITDYDQKHRKCKKC
ncbi:MAG: RNA polymerase sigma factor SigZ [Pseudomonadota bacterium]